MQFSLKAKNVTMVDPDLELDFESPITPLPYSRHEPWSLAPWLTGIIVALVIFVILIPALCSACYHYYSYKVKEFFSVRYRKSRVVNILA